MHMYFTGEIIDSPNYTGPPLYNRTLLIRAKNKKQAARIRNEHFNDRSDSVRVYRLPSLEGEAGAISWADLERKNNV